MLQIGAAHTWCLISAIYKLIDATKIEHSHGMNDIDDGGSGGYYYLVIMNASTNNQMMFKKQKKEKRAFELKNSFF